MFRMHNPLQIILHRCNTVISSCLLIEAIKEATFNKNTKPPVASSGQQQRRVVLVLDRNKILYRTLYVTNDVNDTNILFRVTFWVAILILRNRSRRFVENKQEPSHYKQLNSYISRTNITSNNHCSLQLLAINVKNSLFIKMNVFTCCSTESECKILIVHV